MTQNMFSKISLFTGFVAGICFTSFSQTMSVAGKWLAELSSGQVAEIELPGTLDMAGIGIPDSLKIEMAKPQLLRLTRKVSYIGPCKYIRTIEIPKDMAGKPLRLKMERVLWKSTLVIDDKPINQENISLNSPHFFEIPPLNQGKHIFEITIDNRCQRDISFSNLCHSYTNDTHTIWNGVLGDFTLSVVPTVEIARINVYPDIRKESIEVDMTVNNVSNRKENRNIKLTIKDKGNGHVVGNASLKYTASPGISNLKTIIKLDNPELWNEFSQPLYRLAATAGDSFAETTFGMREVTTDGKSLLINRHKTFLRGTLDCCVFPLTGVPPTDKEGWTKEMKTLKDWGFNHIRFHSWCPPEAAFEVADSIGLYLQTELPVWSLNIGNNPNVTTFLHDEFKNMSANYGNHPSWIMSTCGNELQHDFNVLNDLVKEMRDYDPRHIYAATSFTFEKGHGGHAEPYDQFLITQWTDDGWVRGQGVFDNEPPSFDKNYSRSMNCITVPLISHEIGQYAVYPNIDEINKYTGILDPLNFKAIKNDLERKGLLDKANDYLNATGRFANILYKEEIERALKTPGFSGIQLLGIQDFPGQGTALVGLIDAFWDAKGMVKDIDFKKFNAPVVPLANFPKAVYSCSENFISNIDIANYSLENIDGKTISWSLKGEDSPLKSGIIESVYIPQGEVKNIGKLSIPLTGFKVPGKLTLTIKISDTEYENSWNIWVYPDIDKVNPGNLISTSDPALAITALEKGNNVLYIPESSEINGIESKFLPVFWSPVHFPKQAGGMGVIADVRHQSLKGFPTDGHSDWQWWRPVKNANVMILDQMTDKNTGKNIEPIIGVIDNFYRNRRLGYMFEARCGNGKLLVSSINLKVDSPEMKSFFQGVADYINSPHFNPENEISIETFESISNGVAPIDTTTETSIYE